MMKLSIGKILAVSAAMLSAFAVANAGECYSRLDGDTLRIGNSRIERVYLWNDGHLVTCRVTDKKSGRTWASTSKNADFAVNRSTPSDGKVRVEDVASDGIRPAHQLTIVSYKLGALDVVRCYRVYPGVPAIAVDTRLRGALDGVHSSETDAADRRNIEDAAHMAVKPVTSALDRLSLKGQHWHGRAVEFRDITDWNNNLVDERDFISYRKTNYRGNVLLLSDGENGGGFVFLKEAPCSGVQLAYDKADFISDFGNFTVTGLGLGNADVTPDKWTRAYGAVLCTYDGGEREALEALRTYQKQCRVLDPTRDEMVMMNTWGDRSQDAKVNEAFCLSELEKAARLGITLFQIDDGWQSGKSPNSAVAKGSFKDIHRSGSYWTPDPVKYPHGLAPVVKRGKELGVEVGLWFNPSIQDDFADWEKDAATVVGLWRDYGIRMFKIDGLTIGSKRAEENLRKFFDRVLEDTDNSVMFNLDATASRRGGYHMFNEYGNIFLENRYTDWGNYYPYWTLRNLWQLSKYVPAERLQVEFLNNTRNADKYGYDAFAPGAYDFAYLFATTMAGQPLAWMEASNLPEDAYSIKPLVDAYRAVQHEFHRGLILPVGEEPSGRSFTGFQSLTGDGEGYLLLYREATPDAKGVFETWLPEGATVSLKPVLGSTKALKVKTGRKGAVELAIPKANGFAMYRYKILN